MIIKVLGLIWNSTSDTFKVSTKIFQNTIPGKKLTKRMIASESGTLFDPLGLVIAYAQAIKNGFWSVSSQFIELSKKIHNLSNISIPRHVVIDFFF